MPGHLGYFPTTDIELMKLFLELLETEQKIEANKKTGLTDKGEQEGV